MGLNKAQGDMYRGFVTHCHTHIRGRCPHRCPYCAVQKTAAGRMGYYSGPPRLEEKELSVRYGKGKKIFVDHLNDLFCDSYPMEWPERVLAHCRAWPENEYILQTKNTSHMNMFEDQMPERVILGTTIETNRDVAGCRAPEAKSRAWNLRFTPATKYFVTIEPIMAFDADEMVKLIMTAKPDWVNIGADSKDHGLDEPTKDEVMELAMRLAEFTEIRAKKNLERLTG